MNSISIVLILWYVSGIASFVFWWTRSENLADYLFVFFVAFFAGFTGPFAWVTGYCIHSPFTEHNFFGLEQ
jgi:hypothetical protein